MDYKERMQKIIMDLDALDTDIYTDDDLIYRSFDILPQIIRKLYDLKDKL